MKNFSRKGEIFDTMFLTVLPPELQQYINMFIPGSPEQMRILPKKAAVLAKSHSFQYCKKCGEPHLQVETCKQYDNKLRLIREAFPYFELIDRQDESYTFDCIVKRRHVDTLFLETREEGEIIYPEVIFSICQFPLAITIRHAKGTSEDEDFESLIKYVNIGDLRGEIIEVFAPLGNSIYWC